MLRVWTSRRRAKTTARIRIRMYTPSHGSLHSKTRRASPCHRISSHQTDHILSRQSGRFSKMVSDSVLGAAIARLVRACRPGQLSAKRIRYALEDEFACGDLASRIDFIRDQIQSTLSAMDDPAALSAPSSARAQPRDRSSLQTASSQHRQHAALSQGVSNRSDLPAPSKYSSEKSIRIRSFQARPPSFAWRKEFACDKCEWSFDHNAGLITHQRVHSGIRPYLCDQCGRRFAHKGNMNVHIRGAHGGGRPY